MIRINLLPFRAARTKENIRRQVSVFVLSMILLLVILLTLNMYLGRKVNSLEDKLAGIKKDIKRYEQKAEKVDEFKKKLAELEQKIDIVNQLKTHRKDPPQLLAEITELVVPDRMQMKKLGYNGNSLSIEGIAMDNETVALFMKRLERHQRIADVQLQSARQTTEYNIEMKSFGINCKLAESSNGANQKAKKS